MNTNQLDLSEYILFPATTTLEAIAKTFRAMSDELADKTISDVKKIITESFIDHYHNNKILEYQAYKGETYYYFDTTYKFRDSNERIFCYTQKNIKYDPTHPNNMPQYFRLAFLRERKLRAKIARGIHIADIYFDTLPQMNLFLKRLAEKAVFEDWSFKDYDAKVAHPILKSYLENSFIQGMCNNEILFKRDDNIICMNTGLLNPYFNDIYIICSIQAMEEDDLFKERYINPQIKDSSELRHDYDILYPPKPVSFYQDVKDLIFDCNTASKEEGVQINDYHIFEENIERINLSLPKDKSLYDKTSIASLYNCKKDFEAALNNSLKLAKRNYKLITPQFWPDTGRVQYLVPIYINGMCNETNQVILPNVALCLEKQPDGRYFGTTVLTLGMAYQNARLIAKPDTFWLDPNLIGSKNITEDEEDDSELATNSTNEDVLVSWAHEQPIVTMENIQLTGRQGLKGTFAYLDKEYNVALSPKYLTEIGFDFESMGDTLSIRIIRWDKNASTFNAELV